MIIAKNVQPFFIYVSGIDGRTLFHICMQLHEDLQTVQDGIPWPPRAKDFLCSQSLQACNPPPLQFCRMDCWNNQQLSPRGLCNILESYMRKISSVPAIFFN